MSENTANILQRLGGYHIETRGEREVKVRRTVFLLFVLAVLA